MKRTREDSSDYYPIDQEEPSRKLMRTENSEAVPNPASVEAPSASVQALLRRLSGLSQKKPQIPQQPTMSQQPGTVNVPKFEPSNLNNPMMNNNNNAFNFNPNQTQNPNFFNNPNIGVTMNPIIPQKQAKPYITPSPPPSNSSTFVQKEEKSYSSSTFVQKEEKSSSSSSYRKDHDHHRDRGSRKENRDRGRNSNRRQDFRDRGKDKDQGKHQFFDISMTLRQIDELMDGCGYTRKTIDIIATNFVKHMLTEDDKGEAKLQMLKKFMDIINLELAGKKKYGEKIQSDFANHIGHLFATIFDFTVKKMKVCYDYTSFSQQQKIRFFEYVAWFIIEDNEYFRHIVNRVIQFLRTLAEEQKIDDFIVFLQTLQNICYLRASLTNEPNMQFESLQTFFKEMNNKIVIELQKMIQSITISNPQGIYVIKNLLDNISMIQNSIFGLSPQLSQQIATSSTINVPDRSQNEVADPRQRMSMSFAQKTPETQNLSMQTIPPNNATLMPTTTLSMPNPQPQMTLPFQQYPNMQMPVMQTMQNTQFSFQNQNFQGNMAPNAFSADIPPTVSIFTHNSAQHSCVLISRPGSASEQLLLGFGRNAHFQVGFPRVEDESNPQNLSKSKKLPLGLLYYANQRVMNPQGTDSNVFNYSRMNGWHQKYLEDFVKEKQGSATAEANYREKIEQNYELKHVATGPAHSVFLFYDRQNTPKSSTEEGVRRVFVYGIGSNHNGELGMPINKSRPNVSQLESMKCINKHPYNALLSKQFMNIYQQNKEKIFGKKDPKFDLKFIVQHCECGGDFSHSDKKSKKPLQINGFTMFAMSLYISIFESSGNGSEKRITETVYFGDYIACLGRNSDGVFGLGPKDCWKVFDNPQVCTALPAMKKIKKFCCGFKHCLVLYEDGSLYGMGRSQEGELGIKSNEKNLFYPEEITFFKQFSQNGVKIKDVFAGGKSSFVLMENGEVFGFGYNNFGELGLGEGFQGYKHIPVPTRLVFMDSMKLQGEIIVKIVGGFGFTIFSTNCGRLFGIGYNIVCQLGLGDNAPVKSPGLNPVSIPIPFGERVVDIQTGTRHAIAVTEKNKVFVWGNNVANECGIDTGNTDFVPSPTLLFA